MFTPVCGDCGYHQVFRGELSTPQPSSPRGISELAAVNGPSDLRPVTDTEGPVVDDTIHGWMM